MNEIQFTIPKGWQGRETELMRRLTEIIKGYNRVFDESNMPVDRGEGYSGYRWQLDWANDWFAQIYPVGTGAPVLVVSYRYGHSDTGQKKLQALQEFLSAFVELTPVASSAGHTAIAPIGG
jgi:hypothetical protein